MDLELGEDVRPVGLDGFDAEAQGGGDLLGRFAVGDEAGGFSFAGRLFFATVYDLKMSRAFARTSCSFAARIAPML